MGHMYVLSIDYRLAPEHPFPSALYDVYSAYSWVDENLSKPQDEQSDFFKNVNPNKVFVAGDSAGGSLSIAASIMARDGIKHSSDSEVLPAAKHQPAHQVLIYPVVDHESNRNANGTYILDKEGMDFFSSCYVQDQSILDPEHHHHHLYKHSRADTSNLPEATVITAKFDPLYEEGRLYADKMKKNGVNVTYKEYDTVHGFVTFDFLKESVDAKQFILDTLKQKDLVGRC
ncbi:carboxylesterase [Acrasis kona]|uniref:Carboxylesterase n=1 Tax=Acrasis kona TaxID=1008807 RepID=A0AAW2ZGD6_9EUKA